MIARGRESIHRTLGCKRMNKTKHDEQKTGVLVDELNIGCNG